MGRKILVLCSGFIFLALIFFTLFGGKVYELITPKVYAKGMNAFVTINDKKCILVPKEAIDEENWVYVVNPQEGYSKTLFYLNKRQIKIYGIYEADQSYMLVEEGIVSGDYVVIHREDFMEDGIRVIMKTE